MRLREGGTALVGFVLCSAILTSAVTQDIPLDFFISPETGEPNAVIVVGSKAATEDVISATELAAALGSLYTRVSGITFGERFRAVHVPDSSLYESWENDALSLNYTLQSLWHFDDPNAFWSCNDGAFQPWETHEEIQIRFDPNTNGTTARSYCVPCLYGGDAAHLKSIEDPDLSGGHKVPGLIYRVDNIFVPPSVIVEMWFGIHHRMRGRGPRIFTVPEPWMVMRGMLPQFKFFGTIYTVVDAGPVMEMNSRTGELGELYGTPYMVTGNPHFETQIVLYLNNPSEFGPHTVELVDVEQSKAFFEVSCNGKPVGSFWLIPDTLDGFAPDLQGEFPFDHYDVCNDLNSNGKLDAGEAINIISMDDEDNEGGVFDKWIVDRLEKDVWVDYRWEYYTDDHDDVWGLFTVADFVIDGVRVFTDDQGDGVEIQVYWLENEKVWYNHLCSDPWTAESHDYLLFLDAYQAGWDEIKGNSYLYQPPGTGLWPPAGLDLWNNTVSNSIFIGNGFLDTNDGHIGYEYYLGLSEGYFPEQNDFDRDKGTTNDCRNTAWILQENCQNQHDIEDPVGFNGAGPIVVELNACLCHGMCAPRSEQTWIISGPYVKEPVYFSVEVTDAYFCGKDGILYETLMNPMQNCEIMFADLEETGLVILDIDIDLTRWKLGYNRNLILVGGPVANILVKQLVSEGVSTVDWLTSSGEWEYIAAPYDGCDILIMAGADRDATRTAVLEIIDYLQMKEQDMRELPMEQL